jgi:nucleoside triphosphate pyrophosphatase
MLVLASQSPRRQEILTRAEIPFLVRPAEVDEAPLAHESPEQHVRRLARRKAEAIAARPGDVVLGADTVVVVDGEILGKPEDLVITGVCLRAPDKTVVEVESTLVRFTVLSEEDIHYYAASGEPLDKAGGYAIQGLASKFIDRIEGCYFNVVGLPVALVYRKLRELGALPG